jgi:multidrug efflux pump subunit AcrA (membrane-fusion protein)
MRDRLQNGYAGLRRRGSILYLVSALVVAVIALFAANAVYGFFGSASSNTGVQRTATVSRGTVQSSVTASGNVAVATSATADFSTSGTVSSIKVRTGQHVKAGEVLATLDPTSAQGTLSTDEANLAQAKTTLTTAQAGATASQKAEDAANLLQAQTSLANAKLQLTTDEQTLTKAKRQLTLDKELDCLPTSSGSGSSSSTAIADDTSSASTSSSTGSTSSNTGSSSTSSSSGTTGGGGGTGTGTGTGNYTKAVNESETSSSSSASTPPTASTSPATNVGTSTATLNASIGPNGDDTDYRFQYGTSTSLDLGTTSVGAGSAAGQVSVSQQVTGLEPGTTYYFRAVADNSSGETDGAMLTFTTATAVGPAVTTAAAGNVGISSATLSGTVDPNASDTTYSFAYGTTSAFGKTTPTVDAGSGTTATQVSAVLTGLEPGTTYVFHLEATSASGTTTGVTQYFTTAVASSATTGTASSITPTGATLSGTVSPQGASTSYYFEYGTTAALGHRTATQSAGSSTGSVSVTANATGLDPGRTYSFRLVASNVNGSAKGALETLTTPSALKPTVTTNSASGSSSTSATLSGSVDPNTEDTHYYFEYGRPGSMAKTATVDAGNGSSASQVSVPVSRLKPDSSYTFRLVASNVYGTSYGLMQVLTTAETSCASDASTIQTDEQAVAQQQSSIKSAEASLDETKSTNQQNETVSSATIAQDEAAVTQDEAAVTTAQKALDELTLAAPITGTVAAVNGSVGSTSSGSGSTVTTASSSSSSSSSSGTGGGGTGSGDSSGLVSIESTGQLEVVAGIPEADISNVAVGEPATLTFPALTNTEVAGKVVAVASTSTVVSDVVTYDVTIALVNPPSSVKEGMTTNVSVVTETRSNVLELPSSAITTTGTTSTVQLLQNGQTSTVRVQTGIVGSSSTQIVSGVQKGDVVVIPTVSVSATSTTSSATTGFGGGGFGGFGGGGGATRFGG